MGDGVDVEAVMPMTMMSAMRCTGCIRQNRTQSPIDERPMMWQKRM
jgi:hypothetical protein